MSHGARIESSIIPDHILRRMNPEDRPNGVEGMTREQAENKCHFTLEKELQQQIANYLKLRGIWFERKAMNKRSTGTPGCPDFLLAINGTAIAFECKINNRHLDDDQVIAQKLMKQNGWAFYTIRSFGEVVDIVNWWSKK